MSFIKFVDTTFRNGRGTIEEVLRDKNRQQIAALMDRIGVYEVEIDTPRQMEDREYEFMSQLFHMNLGTRVSVWSRADTHDIRTALNCGCRHIHVSLPVSEDQIRNKLQKDKKWVLDRMQEAVVFAREAGAGVIVGAEDASRADVHFLLQYACAARECGAIRFRYADTAGILDPLRCYFAIQRLGDESGLDIEMHVHDDYGMAVANALAGVEAGARFVDTEMIGTQKDAGICSLAAVVKVFDRFYPGAASINRDALDEFSKYFSSIYHKDTVSGSLS